MKKILLLLISVIVVLSAQLISAEDLGSEIVDCYNFNCSSSDWIIGSGFRIINASGLAVFSSIYYPNSSSLHQEISLAPNEKYKVVLDVKTTWFDWHNFWVELGGAQSNIYNSNGIKTFYLIPTTNQNLTLWVNRTYNQSINANVLFNNISIKMVLGNLSVNFNEGTLSDGAISSTDNIYVNVSIEGSGFQNMTYSLFNETSEINKTSFTSKIFEINWTGLKDGLYFYNVSITDGSGNTSSTETRNISIEASTNISFCRTLSESDVVYNQIADIETSAYDCIYITGSNITFNGNGYSISNGGIYGEYMSYSNVSNSNVKSFYMDNSANNLIENLKISNCTGYCIYIADYTNEYNTFNNIMLNQSNDTGIYFHGTNVFGSITGNSHNIFRDISFYNIAGYDVYMPTISELFTTQENKNNTFINSSFEDEYVSGANNQLIRKWYYQVYINNSNGENMENINVTILDKNNNYLTNITTNSSGLSDVIELTDYYNNAGSITYYSNYTIFAEKICYPSFKVYRNITEEKDNLNILTLGSSTYQNWNLNASENCVIDYPIIMNHNISITGAGAITLNSTLSFQEEHWTLFKSDGSTIIIGNEGKLG